MAHDAVSLTWDDPQDDSITGYQILRRDKDLHGAGEFQVHVDDTGNATAAYVDRNVQPEKRYVYRIKARNAAGLSPRSTYFGANTPVEPNNPATGLPTITGAVKVGKTLTANTSGIADADGMSNATFSYQWSITDGGATREIQGATNATYTLLDANVHLMLKVRVRFTDDRGHQEELTSALTARVAAADP